MVWGLLFDRDYETPPPIQELALIPTPRGDDKSGGDGGSKDDNSRNRWFRNIIDFVWNFCGLQNSYRRAGQEEVHEIAGVQSHTSHVNWEELIKKREAMERGTTECKVHVKHENERNRLEAELFIKAEGSIFREGRGKFFRSFKKSFFVATGLVFCALGVYMAKGGVGVTVRFYPSLSIMKQVKVAARIVEVRSVKMCLVLEMSRSGTLGAWRCPLQEKMSEDQWRTSNAFFNRTGEPSRWLMLVLAVNLPEQFDRAIDDDQLDKMIEVDLPTLEERKRLVQLCFEKYVLKPATTGSRTSRIKIANFDFSKKCQQIAEVTEGLSGREISKIAIAWQNSAYGSPDDVLTEDMMDERVEEAVRQHKQKVEWHQAEP